MWSAKDMDQGKISEKTSTDSNACLLFDTRINTLFPFFPPLFSYKTLGLEYDSDLRFRHTFNWMFCVEAINTSTTMGTQEIAHSEM